MADYVMNVSYQHSSPLTPDLCHVIQPNQSPSPSRLASEGRRQGYRNSGYGQRRSYGRQRPLFWVAKNFRVGSMVCLLVVVMMMNYQAKTQNHNKATRGEFDGSFWWITTSDIRLYSKSHPDSNKQDESHKSHHEAQVKNETKSQVSKKDIAQKSQATKTKTNDKDNDHGKEDHDVVPKGHNKDDNDNDNNNNNKEPHRKYHKSYHENDKQDGRHHHKHVDVHVVVDDDDYTVDPGKDDATPTFTSSTSQSDRQQPQQQQQQTKYGSIGNQEYDWQKCMQSNKPDCWQQVSATNQSNGKTSTTTTTSTTAATSAAQHHVVANTEPKTTSSSTSSSSTMTTSSTENYWKHYAETLQANVQKCLQSKDPSECWKTIAPQPSSSSSTMTTHIPTHAPHSTRISPITPNPAVPPPVQHASSPTNLPTLPPAPAAAATTTTTSQANFAAPTNSPTIAKQKKETKKKMSQK